MTTIFFESNQDAIAVSVMLRQEHSVEESTIVFGDSCDYNAVELACKLNNTTYCVANNQCLLKPSQEDWDFHNCSDTSSLKIYVACLSSYNNGRLYGIWVDCEQEPEDMQEDVDFMLSWSPYRHNEACEDWAIHDTQEWGSVDIGEWDSFDEISEKAKAIAELGDPYVAYLESHTANEASVKDFQKKYRGEYSSTAAYAEEIWTETGMLEGVPEEVAKYIDYERVANDWEYMGMYALPTGCGNYYIFDT